MICIVMLIDPTALVTLTDTGGEGETAADVTDGATTSAENATAHDSASTASEVNVFMGVGGRRIDAGGHRSFLLTMRTVVTATLLPRDHCGG